MFVCLYGLEQGDERLFLPLQRRGSYTLNTFEDTFWRHYLRSNVRGNVGAVCTNVSSNGPGEQMLTKNYPDNSQQQPLFVVRSCGTYVWFNDGGKAVA